MTSSDGRFVAAIPAGYRNELGTARGGPFNFLYLAFGRRTGGFTTNINVVREPSDGTTDINTVVQIELKGVKRLLPDVRLTSSPQPATVGGEPAGVIDYLNNLGTRRLHVRQVIVEHRGWIYVVTYTAAPRAYTASLTALTQVISSWQWTS